MVGETLTIELNLQWKAFRECKNIPDFNRLYEVTSYMSYWVQGLTPPRMKRLLKMTPEYLQVLNLDR